ncbi:MAG: TIGR03557 family F420-dependent LLM class oxidoreductase [Acidimicrobiia bacterium]|nr:TIGR03557 family F420-dependent LLM class oxidoreductase [Acidimicrobiia bacterium]
MQPVGLALSSEEHPPKELVRQAMQAELAGFEYALISDHFHPWTDAQGESPFVWGVLGAIAQATSTLRIGTGVTCPTIRTHPVVIAQAAATAAALMPGRFFLGVGSGENLNEHVVGARWPAANIRLDMLSEAVDVIRLLWKGGNQNFKGDFYEVENARIYTLPSPLPELYLAASSENAAELAGQKGDGLISTAPKEGIVDTFRKAGGGDKPTIGQVHVCWSEDEAKARRTAYEQWPNAAIKGELGQELPLPRHFEQAAEMVTEDDVAELVTCGSDPERHLDAIRKYLDAGYEYVYVHQVGDEQDGFFDFYRREVLPKLG